MPVVLWTDALLYLLVLMALIYALRVRRREHLRAPWRRVMQSPVAMGAAVVLGAYALVALTDSLHFRPTTKGGGHGEVISMLDYLVTPLRIQTEKTYSAPFATHLYAKETIELDDGREVRGYPRLTYGGAHLSDPQAQRTGDILRTSLRALTEAALVSLMLSLLVLTALARRCGTSLRESLRRVLRGRTRVPWRTLLGTAALLIALLFLLVELSAKYHVLGTDKVGQDVLYEATKSIRTGLIIGTLSTLVMLPFAILLGVAAGYFRGWVDDIVQYLYTTLNSIPSVLLIAAVILMVQVYMANHPESFESITQRADLRLLFLCIILGITSWTNLCRLLRGEVLKLREVDYVQAAAAFGVRHSNIMLRHLVPNVMHIVLIMVVLDFSGLVLAEAVLSYINIGVDPSTDSWGNMINSARLELAREPVVWWSLAAAFVFMFALVLAANLFADAVRDAFDPRLRRETA
ncbi:MAG: ABC transporter permease [Nitrococcus mobilis]|nr:ABC transporter permease [Nitrococcus mobilis]